MGLTMGNDRSLLLQGLAGGVLAGLGLCWSGPWWMLPALALLWSSARSPWAAALWGAVAIAISHSWLLALHPLTWLGVPALLSLPLAIAVWLICALAAAVLTGAWSVVGRCLPSPGTLPHALVLALIWGLMETLLARAPLFWIGVGGSVLPGDPWLAGLSRWMGAGGLATVQLILGWGLWKLWLWSRSHAGLSWRWWSLVALALTVVHAIGALAFYAGAAGQPSGDVISLALWQPAIPTREKFSDRRQAELPGRLRAVEARAQRDGAELLLAPEGMLPLDRRRFEGNALPVMSGGFRWVAGQQRSALLLLDPQTSGPPKAIDKHRLVPLGEWVPAWPGLSGLSAVGGLEAGPASRLWPWGGPPAAVAICYEISNGTALARAVADGGQWILAAANLDPYPQLLQRQFLALAGLRSLETARPVASVANTGPTAMITAHGQVTDSLASMRPGLLQAVLQPTDGVTLYVRWREWPLWWALLAAVLALFKTSSGLGLPPALLRRRKTPPPDQA